MLKMRSILAAAGVTLMSVLPAPSAAQQPDGSTEIGTWSGRFVDGGDPTVRITVSRWDADNEWNSSVRLDEDVVRDILRQADANDGFVSFELVREGGSLSFEGQMRRSRGTGNFTFVENPTFRDTMRDLGYGRLDSDEVFASAILDVGPAHARDIADLGFRDLDFDELLSSAIFNVDAEYVAEMERAGYRNMDLDELISFRVFDIDADFAAEARTMGFDAIDQDEESMEQALAMGFGDLDFDDLIAIQIHGITPNFVDEANAMGFGSLDMDGIMAMKIHGMSAEYLQSMNALGLELIDFDEALAFRIHGITPQFVREMQEEGFEDLDADDHLRIRIHGLDDILKKRRRVRRY